MPFDIVDAQLHEMGPHEDWERADQPTRRKLMNELVLGWMDAVGVERALLHPIDDAWGVAAIAAHPDRLAGVFHLHESDEDPDAEVARYLAFPGAVGLRLSFGKTQSDPTGEKNAAKFKAGTFEPLVAAVERTGVPLFCSAYGSASLVGDLARAHPNMRLVVDHMGVAQPPRYPRESPPWKALAPLLELAKYDNVFVKLTGPPVLSETAYPFADLRLHLHRILELFGPQRCMWASDTGRFAMRISWDWRGYHPPEMPKQYPGKHTYAESLFFILHASDLSQREKELLLGDTVRRLTGWPRP